jgi:PAS domain S-box-containing protein
MVDPLAIAPGDESERDIDRIVSDSGATVVRLVAIATTLGGLFSFLADVLATGTVSRSVAMPIVLLGIVVLVLFRRGRARTATTVYLWGATFICLMAGFLVAGMRTPALVVLPLLAMTGGWLLGNRSGWTIAGTTTAILALIAWLDHQGLLPPPIQKDPWVIFAADVSVICAGALLGGASMARFRREFQHAHDLAGKLAKQVSQLEISEERFSALFHYSPLPTSIVHLDGRIFNVNVAWEMSSGIRREQAIGRRSDEFGVWVHPEQFTVLEEKLRRDGKLYGEQIQYRTVHGPRDCLIFGQKMQIDGEAVFSFTLLDQTDRLLMERSQRELNERLEATIAERTEQLRRAQDSLMQTERLASLGSTVAGIAHELNTPIGNVVTVASTLSEHTNLVVSEVSAGRLKKSELTHFLDTTAQMSELMLRSATRAADLIASYKQVAIDQTSEQRREFSLHTLMHDVLMTLHPQFKHASISVNVTIPETLTCDSFPGPLSQVISNLLLNTVAHAFEGRDHGTVNVEAIEAHGRVILRVQDDGIGMDQATLAHVFDPFFTTKLGRGGSGLGLAISHRIATTVLSGTLTAHSQPEMGTVFELQFLRLAPGRI